MTIRLQKPWRELSETELSRVRGQLGVFELADSDKNTIYIGYAGGKSLFGLKGELSQYVDDAAYFRCEINTAYLTRHRELLMTYYADNGSYPGRNTDTGRLGKLSPLGN